MTTEPLGSENLADIKKALADRTPNSNHANGNNANGDGDQPRTVGPPGDPYPNAKLFLADLYSHAERDRLLSHGGAFYHWIETHWAEREDAALQRELYEYFNDADYWTAGTKTQPPELVPFQPTRNKVADLTQALQAATHVPRTVIPPMWLDATSSTDGFVACANGILHVPTRKLHPHSPRFYVHHSVPFDYRPDAPAPKRWLQFLEELWPGDAETVQTLQQIFGYILQGDTRMQKAFMIVGPKRSGKGTIARILAALIGTHNAAGSTLASLATNFGLQPLIGKPLCVISDARIGEGHGIIIERLLSITGEDRLTIDRKYKDPWTGTLPTRILVLTNELPRLNDSSGAVASRFIILVTTQTFYGNEDTRLTDRLLAEMPGILNWTLDGIDAIAAAGRFTQPATSEDAIREMEDLSSPIGAFIRDCCVTGPAFRVRCEALYQRWRAWCEDNGRDKPGNSQTFGRDLRAAVIALKTVRPLDHDGVGRVRMYQGVDLR